MKEQIFLKNKEELKKLCNNIINHPEYVNKTYSGKDFKNTIGALEARLAFLIFDITEGPKRYEDKNSLDYKMTKWCHWMHNHNKFVCCMELKKNNFKYLVPEFLQSVTEQLLNFASAETEEEISKIFDTSYYFHKISGSYKFEKYIWLTEELLDTQSSLLPLYAPCDLTTYIRGEKLHNFYKKKLTKNCDINKIIEESDELWRLYKIAVDKGIIIDNYGKDFACE